MYMIRGFLVGVIVSLAFIALASGIVLSYRTLQDWLLSLSINEDAISSILALIAFVIVSGVVGAWLEHTKHKQRRGDYDRGDFM